MASISSLSSGSSIYGSRNSNIISGLASGMDTESMIEGMVQGIKLKIDGQKQQKTILNWQQQAYRSISDQLVQLSSKYTSYTSSTNLMSESFFKASIITTLGEYADKISASGTTSSNIEILGVKELAKNESVSLEGLNGVSKNDISISGDETGVDLINGTHKTSNLAGKYITFEYNNQSFSIDFPADSEYDKVEDVADAINEQLGSIINKVDNSKMSETFEAVVTDGKVEIKFKDGADKSSDLEITGGSESALEALGLEEGDKLTSKGTIISDSKVTEDTLYTENNIKDILAGATMTISYNGQSTVIKLPEKDSEEYNAIFKDKTAKEAATAMKDYLQNQVDKAFGYNRIDVSNIAEDGKFSPEFKLADENATISITSGSLGVVGDDSIFGIDYGASNKINTSNTLEDLDFDLSNLQTIQGTGKFDADKKGFVDEKGNLLTNDEGKLVDANGNLVNEKGELVDEKGDNLYSFVINDVEVGQYSKNTSLSTIINDVNNSDAGVKVSYSQTSNQFVFTATHGGVGGKIEISDNADSPQNLAAQIFGRISSESNTVQRLNEDGEWSTPSDTVHFEDGTDAKMVVNINGTQMILTSGTNTFNIDGLSVTANEVFNTEKINDDGTINNDVKVEGVTFTQKADTDKIVDAIKTFVEDYNKMLADLGTAYTTKPDNDYQPLTDDQKAEMTEKQIEEYEAKAKEGLLFADPDLKSLASSLRFLFSGSDLSNIGITTSTTASDRGKLSIDEEKLRAAVEGNLDSVKKAFSAPIETDSNGNVVSGGAMQQLKEVLDKYAGTTGATKGILIEKAGSQYSPTALLDNTIKSQIEDIDEEIDRLTDQLNDKIDFYTSKFTQLEMLISQMNSQSSYLSSMSGGY